MEANHSVSRMTFLLAWVAGFCDTATFVAGDSIFSAHVTGNFIVFAAQVAAGNGYPGSWIKLITFPIFVIAVIAGGWVVEKAEKRYRILLVEGIILILCGISAMILSTMAGAGEMLGIYPVVMTTVFAMGLQNAFGKLFAKETHGPTTMMTGNVTQMSLDLGILLRHGLPGSDEAFRSLRKQFITVGGFLAGCILGAVFARWVGLSSILLPGAAIVICYLQRESAANHSE